MPIIQEVSVTDLTIDLQNYRTVLQQNETAAIQAMITISPDYFWALMGSLIDDGYLPTENIIVIDYGNKKVVKEGNRRIASLKIIHGYVSANEFDMPDAFKKRISSLPQSWRQENLSIPCTIYDPKDSSLVDKIVTLTHGKGQKAGRDDWEAIARARHNQKNNASPEYGLVLVEKYLTNGTNLTPEQKLRWSGKYPLSVLYEALPKIFSRVGCNSTAELSSKYPNINFKKELDNVLLAIGLGEIGFPVIRRSDDFLMRYGIAPIAPVNTGTGPASPGVNTSITSNPSTSQANPASPIAASSGTAGATSVLTPAGTNTPKPTQKVTATSAHDIKTVRKHLRGLKLYGNHRTKLFDIKKEMLELKIDTTPIAFVFLLRSMVELSAKAFCEDKKLELNAPTGKKKDGSDKTLGDTLRDVVDFLTQQRKDKQMLKLLHGPITELNRPDGILSVTSMNQLVHNPAFIIKSTDIPALFSSIFPLIENMNN